VWPIFFSASFWAFLLEGVQGMKGEFPFQKTNPPHNKTTKTAVAG
jgi:hypothetical protein